MRARIQCYKPTVTPPLHHAFLEKVLSRLGSKAPSQCNVQAFSTLHQRYISRPASEAVSTPQCNGVTSFFTENPHVREGFEGI